MLNRKAKRLEQRNMNKYIISIILVVFMNGCANGGNDIDRYNKADPEADALTALENRDFRFLAMPLRGTVIPGIDPSKALQYELRCGTKLMSGVSDAVRGQEQLKKMQQAHDYAAKYNAVIKTRCNP